MANKVKYGTATPEEEQELREVRLKLLDETLFVCRHYQYEKKR